MKTFSKKPGEESAREISCPVCGEENTKPYWSYPHFAYSLCPRCGLVYQNPQPVQDDVSVRYDDEYYSYEIENEESFFHLERMGLDDIDFESLVEELPAADRSVLDIGCATGRLIADLQSNGLKVQGVEICRPAAEHGIENHGVPIYIGTLETAAFADSSFGVVHCSHLIEHLTDPSAFVHEAKRLLAPGGMFIITTPNVSGFQAKLMKAAWRSAIADHLCLFSKTTLRKLLNSAGFDVVRIKTWGGIGVGITKDFIKRPVDRLAKRFGFGDVMIMVARPRS